MFTPISLAGLLGIALLSGAALCQESGPPPGGPGENMGPPPMEGRRPPMERAFRVGPHGRWWNNPEFAQKLGLTADQQKRMEAVFEQSRPRLMDLSAAVHKEETAMEPLLAADQPDEGKILAQIDRVAQARAELEKSQRPHAPGPAPRAHPATVEDASSRRAARALSPLRAGAAGRRAPNPQ